MKYLMIEDILDTLKTINKNNLVFIDKDVIGSAYDVPVIGIINNDSDICIQCDVYEDPITIEELRNNLKQISSEGYDNSNIWVANYYVGPYEWYISEIKKDKNKIVIY